MKTRIGHRCTSAKHWLEQAIQGQGLLAALLLGLLLIQPTLCVAHCVFDAHQSQGSYSKSEYNHLLCDLADGETAQIAHIPVPAFWPSLPTTLPIVLLLMALMQASPPPPPAQLRSVRWSPPSPPPRIIADSR